ncbi:MAG: hypothetical protein IT518_06195 [Burkholderiales bacterium]|nr:hypothetical protein [Burkholderiales bacterium]
MSRADAWARTVGPALLLALGAAACAYFAVSFRHAGPVPLALAAAILGCAAAGVVLSMRSAWTLALLLFAALSLLLLYATAEAVRLAVSQGGRQGHAWLAGVLTWFLALVLGAAASIAAAQVVVLWVGRAAYTARDLHPILAVPLAAVAFLAVAWVLGHDVWWTQIWAREKCAAGSASACAGLAGDTRHFGAAERDAFARAGCAGGDTRACLRVTGDPGVLARRCEQGNAELCLAYAKRIYGTEPAAAALTRACELEVGLCARAGEAARDAGDEPLMRTLLQRGCDAKDSASCWLVFARIVPKLSEPERSRVELDACLASNVNACRGLVRRDAEAFCPRICAGSGNNNRQSCDYCGEAVRDGGRAHLAEAWFAGNCERGWQPSCQNLGDMLTAQGRAEEAQAWLARAGTNPATAPRPPTARSPATIGTLR